MPPQRRISTIATGLFGLFLSGCDSGASPELTAEVVIARDRAAGLGARAQWREAHALLEPLVRRKDAALEDLLRAANAQLAIKDADDRVEKALPILERAEKLAPDDPVVLWCRYRVAAIRYETGPAVEALRRLSAQRPEDFTVGLALASALDDLDEPEAEREAQALYRALLAIPPERSGSWRMTVLYRLAQSLIREGLVEEAEPLFAEMTRLEARGLTRPGVPEHEPDTLGAVLPHTPDLFEVPRPAPRETRFRVQELAPAGAAQGARVVQLGFGAGTDVSAAHGANQEELYAVEPQASIVSFGARGVALASSAGTSRPLDGGACLDLVPIDRWNAGASKGTDLVKKSGDKDLDLLLVAAAEGGAALRLLQNEGGRWTLRSEPLAALPASAGTGRLLDLDFDHDGDVDVLVTAPGGPRLLRNDGLDGAGGFTDATAEAGLPQGDFRAFSEDVDRDNDVDLLLFERASGRMRLASNERGGRFSDASATLPADLQGRWIVPADLDGDSWVDLAVFGAELSLYTRTELGGWRMEVRRFPLAHAPTGEPRAADWDLDGTFDLLWPCAEAPAAGLLAPGFANGGLAVLLGERFPTPVGGPASLEVADLDADHDLDLLRLDDVGLRAHLTEGAGNGILLAFQGHKDNARGIGSIVELRAGLRYRRLYYRGLPELVGFGGAPLDVLRVTWPNGVMQTHSGLAPGAGILVAQRLGQIGSCPFLYTWNGSTYEFVSDVLGITPLGLPMAPGMPGSAPRMVPPDHDEYVLVKGEQLVPKDGVYELQLTEELREVTYLDRIRLDVVDHPLGTEVFPNERFSFPPFPEAHTHVVRDLLAPRSAVDQAGREWTDELARDDRRFALPFEALAGPYRGLATPHALELAFDPARVRGATRLRLFLNGWFYWTDASVNVSVARHPDHEFVPPLLAVPDGEGGWRECGSIGFPAGKLKTMAADVTGLLNRDDPRLRLTSTLRLYWDSIRLATDADDSPHVTTPLEPTSARLWQRGFSRSFALLGEHDCEWFVWDELEREPRWNQHPGWYTRLGETLPLLTAIDDRFVIMGAGDALTVRFDATGLPALPDGWRRDFLVFLDGWAKDRDPNTLEALYVEPLPFHGMRGYPYGLDSTGAGEGYPDDELHRAYRREWNTRPATRWIEALVPFFSGRARTTSTMPASKSTPATTTESVMRSPRTTTPAAPATSG
jgi:tetratricopeptide (TPR) repeat protein